MDQRVVVALVPGRPWAFHCVRLQPQLPDPCLRLPDCGVLLRILEAPHFALKAPAAEHESDVTTERDLRIVERIYAHLIFLLPILRAHDSRAPRVNRGRSRVKYCCDPVLHALAARRIGFADFRLSAIL